MLVQCKSCSSLGCASRSGSQQPDNLVLSFMVMAAADPSSALQEEFLLLSLLPFCFMYPKLMLGFGVLLVWVFVILLDFFFFQTKVIKCSWNYFFCPSKNRIKPWWEGCAGMTFLAFESFLLEGVRYTGVTIVHKKPNELCSC